MAMTSMGGKQLNDTDGGSGGLLLSACRRHLSPSHGGGSTSAASRSAGKRRRLEQQHGEQSQSQAAAGDKADGYGSAAADATDGHAVGSSSSSSSNAPENVGSGGTKPPTGPFRVLLTTDKTPSGTADTAVDGTSSSSRDIQNRKAAMTAGSARLLSSVAMDLAHSLAVQSASLPCRGCGANNGTSSTRNQQCQCIDVVYIVHEAASAGGGGGGDQNLVGAGGHNGDDTEEEEVGADLFPLRCRRVDHSMDDNSNSTSTSNDNDDADDIADTATNSRSSSQSSPPSWDEGALSRIQIRRMRDGTDLVRYLATVPLLPPHQQPRRGIVLHDIGSFVLGNTAGGNGGGASSTQSVASTLGPSYYTIDLSTVLTQILSILGNTVDYLERQRRKALKLADSPPAANATESTSDAIVSHGGEFSLLVTMDGNAYSQLPPHTKPVLQNWLPIVGTLRSNRDDNAGPSKNGVTSGWSLDLNRDEWRLSRSSSDCPTSCSGAASCAIKQSQESADGMPEIFWSVKE